MMIKTLGRSKNIVFKSIFLVLIGVALTSFAFPQQNVGSAARNISVVTMDGETLELDQLKGKVVLLTFWSTRCQICVAEIPNLNKLVDKYEGRNVVFVGLTMNNELLVKNFLKTKPFKFKIVPESLGVVLKYADRDARGRLLMGYPAHFLVDKTGKVVLKNSGFDKTPIVDRAIGNLVGNPDFKVSEKDVSSIDGILKATYDVISGGPGEIRNWDRFRALFHKQAKLVPTATDSKTKETRAFVFTPDEYIKRSEPIMMKNGFFEKEISRKVERFGNIAHVFSTYEGRYKLTDEKPFLRGINSFQLLYDGKRWWVLSIYWQAESKKYSLPEKYLPKK